MGGESLWVTRTATAEVRPLKAWQMLDAHWESPWQLPVLAEEPAR